MSSPPPVLSAAEAAESQHPADADWTPRADAVYEPAMSLPSGTDAYTAHGDGWDRYLTRTRTDSRARAVRVRSVLVPGDRVRIVPGALPETWEAVRD